MFYSVKCAEISEFVLLIFILRMAQCGNVKCKGLVMNLKNKNDHVTTYYIMDF
jgi:hypothetical protein